MAYVETLHTWARTRRKLKVRGRRHLLLFFIIITMTLANDAMQRYTTVSDACIWIVNGLTIGLILSVNPRRRNELLFTAFYANLVANAFDGEDVLRMIGYSTADMVEIFLATYAFRKMSVRSINLTRVKVLIKAAAAAPLIGSLAAASFLAAWEYFALRVPFSATHSLTFYGSDALGDAVIIPLYWAYRRKPKLERANLFRGDAEVAFGVFCLVVVGLFWQSRYPFLFLLFPVLIPVIYTSGFLGAARAVLATAAIGIVATARGHGPLLLIHTSVQGRVLVLQFYLTVVLVTAFAFAVLLMQRGELFKQLRESEVRYREMARVDGLTQLPNRREFDNFLDVSRQRSVRQNTPLSLLLIDIDHFKKLNDRHGHTVGDEYLRKVATAVASAVPRKTDLVARYGGEEFGVILDTCDDAGAMMVAERIKEAIAILSRGLAARNRPSVTVSIGVATTPPSLRTTAKVLIDAADQGLYAAKRNGRDRVERGTYLGAEIASLV